MLKTLEQPLQINEGGGKQELPSIELSEREKLKEIIDRFGESLDVLDSEIECEVVTEHLEHLGLLPENFVSMIKNLGIKIKIRDTDILGMSNDDRLKNSGPRGLARSDWNGMPGGYNPRDNIVYAGKGNHGSSSLILHELCHGIDKSLGLNNDLNVIDAHKRLYHKFTSYFQQDGPGGLAGREEFLAESFADYFRLSKSKFIKRYGEDWHLFLEKIITRDPTN